jgi:AP-2 complex subunit mu-1
VAWRRPDIKYRKNEVFVDVIEKVNLLMSAEGSILKSDVSGQVMVRANLTGMPECKFGLNDKQLVDSERKIAGRETTNKPLIELDDCQFHQCVRLGNFGETKSINFIPPDGEFELMKYRSTENVSLPFKVTTILNETSSRVEYRVVLRSLFPPKITAQNIQVNIPTPTNTSDAKISVSAGKCKYKGSDNSLIWKIQKMQGGQEVSLTATAQLSLTTTKKTWSRPPISLDFEVVMFTSSGLLVRYLRVFEKSNYIPIKWVRYMTKAGSYQIRI